MSKVPAEQQRERLQYILENFPLDETQRAAFDKSTRRICAGIHLIHGPPGTGKTRTALVIILTMTALDLRVLLAAGSNKGVDNLAVAFVKAISEHPKLARWCGRLVRFRTPAHQLSVLRADNASNRPLRRHKGDLSGSEQLLEPYQMHYLAEKHAIDHQSEDQKCAEFLAFLDQDREGGLSRDATKGLKSRLEYISRKIFTESKIVATTLSNSIQDGLRFEGGFDPSALICDESGQFLNEMKGKNICCGRAQPPDHVKTCGTFQNLRIFLDYSFLSE